MPREMAPLTCSEVRSCPAAQAGLSAPSGPRKVTINTAEMAEATRRRSGDMCNPFPSPTEDMNCPNGDTLILRRRERWCDGLDDRGKRQEARGKRLKTRESKSRLRVPQVPSLWPLASLE